MRQLALGAIIMRILYPLSKEATSRLLSENSNGSSLGHLLGLGPMEGKEVLAMWDWLDDRQSWIQRSLARRHLEERTMILYDVSSSYFEGSQCILSAFGSSRDKRRDRQPIVYGLLCNASGCPVAIQVFEGNTADSNTLGEQIRCIQKNFGLSRVVLVGAETIHRKIGQTIHRKMAKHDHVEVTDTSMTWQRLEGPIRDEKLLDGIDVVRTNVSSDPLNASQVVSAYKSLTLVEQAFRTMKTSGLRLRPIDGLTKKHVQAHVFLCFLAYDRD